MVASGGSVVAGLVLLTVILLLVIIFRFVPASMFSGTSVTYVQRTRVQQRITELKNPFRISIPDPKSATLTDGVKILVSSVCEFKVRCYWLVSAVSFHNCTSESWLRLNEGVTDGDFWQDSAAAQGDLTLSEPCHEKPFHLRPDRAIAASDLGLPPRHLIPLVVILMRDSVSCCSGDTDVVALISSIHISDDIVGKDTGFLEQYLKQANGRTCLLQQLYVSLDESRQSSSRDVLLCVVCRAVPVSLALLPCRHTCMCETCFQKVQSCPMCRSPILTFFRVDRAFGGNSVDDTDPLESRDRQERQTLGQRWRSLNDWLVS